MFPTKEANTYASQFLDSRTELEQSLLVQNLLESQSARQQLSSNKIRTIIYHLAEKRFLSRSFLVDARLGEKRQGGHLFASVGSSIDPLERINDLGAPVGGVELL